MLSVEPNIFFIDDKKEDVDVLIELYRNEGFGVKYYNADLIEGDSVPDENSFSNANLLFLDIYYNSERQLDKEKCAEWVSGIIPENSFYILVIWSQDTDEAEEVITEIVNENRPPFITIIKQKSDYQIKEGWDFDKLRVDIDTEIGSIPEIEELAIWKKSINNARNLVIGHLSRKTTSEELRSKLQKIIVGHGGTYLISTNDNDFKREILFDALDSVLISNTKSLLPKANISEANNKNLYSIPKNIQGKIDTKLNSWFHFKLQKEPLNQEIIKPGIICNFNDDSLQKLYALIKDDNIEEFLKHQITESEKKDSQTKLIDIVLLISRPCDIAQNKYGRNLKLMSGLLIKKPARKDNPKKVFKTGNKYDSIKLFDHLSYNESENDIALIFDFRYVFSIPENDFINKFENVKIFNKELLSEIQVEYSSYSSRLGITQII